MESVHFGAKITAEVCDVGFEFASGGGDFAADFCDVRLEFAANTGDFCADVCDVGFGGDVFVAAFESAEAFFGGGHVGDCITGVGGWVCEGGDGVGDRFGCRGSCLRRNDGGIRVDGGCRGLRELERFGNAFRNETNDV